MQIRKICAVCEKEFYVWGYLKDKAKYCSTSCYHIALTGVPSARVNSRIQKMCPVCGKNFEVPRCHERIITCSRECGYAFRKKYTPSKEYGKRIRIICLNCKKEFERLESKLPHNRYCSRECYIEQRQKFVKYPSNQRFETREWVTNRLIVLKRDNFLCHLCGKTDDLQVHHKVPYSYDANNSLSNLVTLCKSCHFNIHKLIWDHPEFKFVYPQDV